MLDQPLFAAVKARLSDVPGIDAMSVSNIGGRLVFGLGGKVAAVRDGATDAEIDSAIRIIFGGNPPPAATKGTSMSVTGAAHAGLSLKQLMAQHKQRIADGHAKLAVGFDKLGQAGDALNNLGDQVNTEADDLLATVGQFTNDLG